MTVRWDRRAFVRHCSVLGAVVALPGCSQAALPALGSSRQPLRIIFYTDVHAKPGQGVPDALMRAAEAINAQKGDLILGGGDLIADGFEAERANAERQWDAYMTMHDAIEGEHHAVIGNHDLVGVLPADGSRPLADPRSSYKERLGVSRTFYSFDVMGYRVILLDSIRVSGDESQYHGWISKEQQQWLQDELLHVARTTPIILVLHIPLLTSFFGTATPSASDSKPNRVIANSTDVLDLFREHNLRLVLQGHLHVSESLRWGATTFITGGAISGNWWSGGTYHGTGEGFNVITIHSDRIEWEYVGYR